MASEAYEHVCDGAADEFHEQQRGQSLHIPDGPNFYPHTPHGPTHPFKILRTPPYCHCLNGQLPFEVQDRLRNYVHEAPHDGIEYDTVEHDDEEHEGHHWLNEDQSNEEVHVEHACEQAEYFV